MENNIHEGHRKRLLDKVMKDSSILSEHELLEALLFYSIPRRNTNETAKILLDACGGTIRSVLDADMEVLSSIPGVGKYTAAYLKLLGVILKEYPERKHKRVKVFNFASIIDYVYSSFEDFEQEYFFIYFINNKNEIIHTMKMTNNSHCYVNIDLSELTKKLSLLNPKGILLAHNHPRGMPKPSSEDDVATGRIFYLLALNKVALLDHIIVSENGKAYSYYKEGRLEEVKSFYLS